MSRPQQLPAHLKKWNWGAFLLNWVWGIGNGVYIALLMFVPGVNLVILFMLGAKGNEWAWQKGDWASEEDFVRSQKIWARVGFGALIGFPVFIAAIFVLVFTLMRHSEPFELSFGLVQADPAIIATLGEPVELDSWMITGNINYENNQGHANISYQVKGPRGSGVVHFVANLHGGNWIIEKHIFTVLPSGREINLANPELADSRLYPAAQAV